VVVFGGGVGVRRAPRRRVEFGFFVALSAEEGGELPEAGLPRDVAVLAASSEADVAVAVDEDNGCLRQLLSAAGLASKGGAFEVVALEVPLRIVLIVRCLLFLRKAAKSLVNPQVMSSSPTGSCCSEGFS
jgi:hypothetical protein